VSVSRESKKIEEIKQLVEFRQCTNKHLRENGILRFPVLPDSAEAQVI